jgi:hypothetical protein
LLIAENRQAVKDAIAASAKGIVGAVTTVSRLESHGRMTLTRHRCSRSVARLRKL